MISPIHELFKFGWQKTKGDFWFLFLVQILIVVATAAVSYPRSPLTSILSLIVGIMASVSIITLALRMHDGAVGTWGDLFAKYRSPRLFLNYFLASLFSAVIVVAGAVLLIIPGFWFAVRLQFYKFVIVDKDPIGPVDALRTSYAITRGYFWKLLGMLLSVIILNIIGFLALGVGLFVTIPITLFAYAKLYRELGARATFPAN